MRCQRPRPRRRSCPRPTAPRRSWARERHPKASRSDKLGRRTMDLLEYQGKQLFARHGVPVPSGAPATTVQEAVAGAREIGYTSVARPAATAEQHGAAADELGFPCVVKAQRQIGGRGKARGIKVAQDRVEA